MWDNEKRLRLHQLRERQGDQLLTAAEQAELVLLETELEAAEEAYLTPAVAGLRQQRQTLEEQNRALEVLVIRKEALVRKLREFLVEAQAERQAIECEVAAVLAGSRGAESDE